MGIGTRLDAFKWLEPCLKADRIVYIGLRDVDAGEKKVCVDFYYCGLVFNIGFKVSSSNVSIENK